MQPSPALPPRSRWGAAFGGVGYLGQGFRMWLTSPRLMLLGAIPALIVGLVYVAGIVVLILNIDAIAVAITPFASSWPELWQTLTRVAATLAVLVVSVLFVAYTYTAVTLAVGDPFYEKIWRQVETRLGDAPAERDIGLAASLGRGLADAVRMLLPAIGIGLVVFVCGFIPIVGSLLAISLGAFFGGWLLVVELTGFAFDERGHTLGERRRMLRANRAQSLGFGIATYLLFLIPVAAVFVMPSAVAGAALLSRAALAAEPDRAAT